MKLGWHRILIIALVVILASASFFFFFMDLSGGDRTGGSVSSFTARSFDDAEVSLVNSTGKFTVVHITQLESPMCVGCEVYINQQLRELAILAERNDPDIDIITLNVRKNPYSGEGWKMAIQDFGINISWGWIEEVSDYPISNRFLDYTMVDGGMANPAIIIVDDQLKVVDISHIYSLSRGKIDGIQTADAIQSKIERLASDQVTGPDASLIGDYSISFGGMLALGVITSFSPCSIALLMAIVSYIGAMNESKGAVSTSKVRVLRGIGIGSSFTIGMALIFLLIGLFVAYIGEFVRWSSTFYLITGAILVVLGINSVKPLSEILTGLRQLSRPNDGAPSTSRTSEKSGPSRDHRSVIRAIGARSSYLAAFVLGILFSIGWAPCALSLVLPVLVMIMAQNVPILIGGAMMFIFGLGHGLVIIPFCAATGEMKGRIGNKYIKAGSWIKNGFGAVVIVLGLLYAIRYFGYAVW